MMITLTDNQISVLAAAAASPGHVLPATIAGIKAPTLALVRKSLLAKGLLEAGQEGSGTTITKAGLAAIGKEAGSSKAAAAPATAVKPPKSEADTPPPGSQPTKVAVMIGLLKRTAGATIAELQDATGWQPHSVRGAISGTIGKKLGLAVMSAVEEGRGRVYRIVAAAR